MEALPANIPLPLSSFVGREREIEEVRRRLPTARLVTLTGPGGCGKSRLALEVARDVAPELPHGACLVELASLADPDLLPQQVATTLAGC